jgi:predicted amidohydrolase
MPLTPSPREPFLAAVVQLTSTEDRAHNLAQAEQGITTAAQRGARLVVLPELFNGIGRPEIVAAAAEEIPGPTSQRMSDLARQHRLVLCAGSLAHRDPTTGKYFNTSLLFGPDGAELARYQKIHLFDIQLPGRVAFTESTHVSPGKHVVVVDSPVGRLGIAICYDLRFPELFRRLADQRVEILLIPSAFTRETGRDHWEILLRARAIENQAYVLAANQFGAHSPHLVSYGRSQIIDPWGQRLAEAPDGPSLASAEIDLARLDEIRRQLPALEHRRLT